MEQGGMVSAVSTANNMPLTEAATLKKIDAHLPPSGFTSGGQKPITDIGAPTTLADNRTNGRREPVNLTANDSTGSYSQAETAGAEGAVTTTQNVKITSANKGKKKDRFTMILLVGVLVVAGMLFMKKD